MSSILTKRERKQFDLRYHSSQVKNPEKLPTSFMDLSILCKQAQERNHNSLKFCIEIGTLAKSTVNNLTRID